jgi:tRNA threonylcarbamoyladenosine biosynthesis protein TsaE
MRRIVTRSAGETEAAGEAFAARLTPGSVVAIAGTLGTGKTRFVVGICRGLGARGNISSPTFTIINEYPAPVGSVIHADLYRIRSAAELAEVGLQEYFTREYITLIEWPEVASGLLPPDRIEVRCEHGPSDDERIITMEGNPE